MAVKNDADRRFMFALCVGKRPEDELYQIGDEDPWQIKNLADDPEYAETLAALKAQMMADLAELEDPRALGNGDDFATYQYFGRIKNQPK